MGKYFNLLEKNKDLVIDSMGKTIQIFKGVSDYPDEIAEKFPSIFELCDHEDGEDCDCLELCDEKCEDCDCEDSKKCETDEIEMKELGLIDDGDEFDIELEEDIDEDNDFDDLKEIEDLLGNDSEDQPGMPDNTGETDEEVMNDTIHEEYIAKKFDWGKTVVLAKDMDKDELDNYANNIFAIKLDKRKSLENMMIDFKTSIDELNKEV